MDLTHHIAAQSVSSISSLQLCAVKSAYFLDDGLNRLGALGGKMLETQQVGPNPEKALSELLPYSRCVAGSQESPPFLFPLSYNPLSAIPNPLRNALQLKVRRNHVVPTGYLRRQITKSAFHMLKF